MSEILKRRPENMDDKEFYEWVTELIRIHEEHLLMIDRLKSENKQLRALLAGIVRH